MKGLTTTFDFTSKEQRLEFKNNVNAMESGISETVADLVDEFNTNADLRLKIARKQGARARQPQADKKTKGGKK